MKSKKIIETELCEDNHNARLLLHTVHDSRIKIARSPGNNIVSARW